MNVLGVNGKLDGHDPSAALFVDGQLRAAVEEERFSGTRHEPGGMPHHAASWCLRSAGLGLDDVDAVALGWDPRLQVDAPEPAGDDELLDLLLPRRVVPRRRRPRLVRVPHHLAHAACAFYTSPFDHAVCLVVDGSGERESISAWRCQGGELVQLWSLPFANSLGFFYEAATLFVGLGKYNEGKTMGLAAWGSPALELPSPVTAPPVPPAEVQDADHYTRIRRAWLLGLEAAAGVGRNRRRAVADPDSLRVSPAPAGWDQVYRDLAASAQHRLEEDLLELARLAMRDAGLTDLCLAGGVALNCVANGRLARELGCRLHVPPAAHDGGVALGAAALVSAREGQVPKLDDGHVFSGPAFATDTVVDRLRAWGLRFTVPNDPQRAAADLLAAGRTVAWFEGGAELGPRALGGRSLLADPSAEGMLDHVNTLKHREPWRPLGPSLTAAHAPTLFGGPIDAPFMLVNHTVVEAARPLVGAAVHVDGSTRPQIVDPELRPAYHRLLELFTASTGIPAVLNTSFNVSGPIVLTPRQAVATFMTSGIDALVLQGAVLVKPG